MSGVQRYEPCDDCIQMDEAGEFVKFSDYEKLEKDAERYRTMRRGLYVQETIDIGEAYVRMKVIGGCPDTDKFDKAIDALRAEFEGRGEKS